MSKGLEALNYLKHRYEIERANQSELNIIEKELKALEIMKEKQIDIRMFIIYDLEYYNNLQNNDYCKLTNEEDDLLQEVLL